MEPNWADSFKPQNAWTSDVNVFLVNGATGKVRRPEEAQQDGDYTIFEIGIKPAPTAGATWRDLPAML